MDNQEAIRRIKEFGLYHAIGDLPNSAKTVEAFNMAIEALSDETVSHINCDQCKIDRVGVLQQQLAELHGDYETLKKAYNDALADRPQGEWKYTITGQPYCSNCEYIFGEDEEFSPFWDYCPMCGARIRGKA